MRACQVPLDDAPRERLPRNASAHLSMDMVEDRRRHRAASSVSKGWGGKRPNSGQLSNGLDLGKSNTVKESPTVFESPLLITTEPLQEHGPAYTKRKLTPLDEISGDRRLRTLKSRECDFLSAVGGEAAFLFFSSI